MKPPQNIFYTSDRNEWRQWLEAELRGVFDVVIPGYDRERFHLSDMRKVAQWFNILVAAGMTDFSLEEPEQAEQTAE